MDERKEYTEKDWKLFRKKVIVWQEAYMDKLNHEYIELLGSDKDASEKFWELNKRIKEDKKATSVICEVNKSNMIYNILSMINEGSITVDDLDEFSDYLKETINISSLIYNKKN